MDTAALSARDPAEVTNQVPALEDYNLFASDRPLRDVIARWAPSAPAALERYGAVLGSAETLALGELANSSEPVLRTHDRHGRRSDRVDFHPAYHRLMELGVAEGVHSSPWGDGADNAHVSRAAAMYLRHQVDQGTSCPLTMTYAVVPSLKLEPAVAARWLPKVLSRTYDPRFAPMEQKSGVIFGMAMTERQGGSDVRSNSTRATAAPDGSYRLEGHKWFCSAPMCDAFLVLGQAEGGLTCFLVPRFCPDGSKNEFWITRLKSKLGNRSNASSEIEFHGTYAERVGPPGRGVATIIEMVRHTRLDCAIGGAALTRRAVAEASHHVRHRWAFGRPLIEQPLMRNVVADLLLESEAVTLLAFRLAASFDGARVDQGEAAFARAATPIAKFWATKQETAVVREAMECLGGNGYVEDAPIARLFRESPLNSIWEGAGNVQCLDFARALRREPAALPSLRAELDAARGGHRDYDRAADEALAWLGGDVEASARRIVERLGRLLQASLMLRYAPAPLAELFCASRLGGARGESFGTLADGSAFGLLLERGTPHLL